MNLKIKPLGDRVVVRPISAEQKLASGIMLPDTAQEKPQQGEVLAVGSGRVLENGTRVPLEIKVGETVMYSKFGGTEIKIDEEELLILNERDILAIM